MQNAPKRVSTKSWELHRDPFLMVANVRNRAPQKRPCGLEVPDDSSFVFGSDTILAFGRDS